VAKQSGESNRSSKRTKATRKRTSKTTSASGRTKRQESKAKASKAKRSKTTKSKSRAKRTQQAVPSNPETAKPLPKTRLSNEDLEQFRQILLEKRAQIVGDIHLLNRQSLHNNRLEATGDLSTMPFHPADVGSDNFEQEFTVGLMENEHELLREIDEALQRIDNRTYGVCLATGKPITKARLRAKPWARYCIEYARMLEKGQAPRA